MIYHLAAWAHEGLSQFIPIQITETNYNAFLNLVVPAINYGLKKIVVCSSMSVYGDQKSPFSESMPRKPVDMYGIAKAAMENATEILSSVYGFDYVIVQPHNVYGPRQNMADPYRNMIAIFVNRLLNNQPFYIYGTGKQKRAFTYIDDLTPYLAKTGLDDGIKNEIYNIGPRQEYSINFVARLILNEFNLKLKPIYLQKRPTEVEDAYCTSEKAEKDIGFRVKTNLVTGIRKTIEWANITGYQKPKYLKSLEINSPLLPKTWQQKLI